MSGIPQIIQCLKGNIKEGDKILFTTTHEKSQLGKVIHSNQEGVLVQVYLFMDSEILQKFLIAPINPDNFPLSFYDGLVEVYKTSDETFVERSNILDLVFNYLLQRWSLECFTCQGQKMCIAQDIPW
jgi:hypothetical protein